MLTLTSRDHLVAVGSFFIFIYPYGHAPKSRDLMYFDEETNIHLKQNYFAKDQSNYKSFKYKGVIQ